MPAYRERQLHPNWTAEQVLEEIKRKLLIDRRPSVEYFVKNGQIWVRTWYEEYELIE